MIFWLYLYLCNFSVVSASVTKNVYFYFSQCIYKLCFMCWFSSVMANTWEETLNEMLSVLGWPVGSLWEINLCDWCAKTQPLVDSIIPQSGMMTSMSLAINLSHKKVGMSVPLSLLLTVAVMWLASSGFCPSDLCAVLDCILEL